MKKSIIAIAIATLMSGNLLAENQTVVNKEELKNQEVQHMEDKTILSILKHETFAKRYILLKSYATNNKVIKIKKEGKTHIIPINSYLLMEGFEEEALKLLKDGVTNAFEKFDFKNNEYNDVLIAIINEQVDYFEYAAKTNKEKLNNQFNFNNEEGYYLLMAIAENKTLQSGLLTTTMLELGASPYIQTKNGHTAEKVAANRNNNYFLEALHSFENKKEKNTVNLNSALPYKERVKQERIIQNFKAGMLKELSKDMEKLHDQWISLIIYGYNEAAEMVYKELAKQENFDINKPRANGINAMMAASMSSIPSGNIEYAHKLIERGIDVNYMYKETTAMDVAVKKDAYKIVILLIKNKANFIQNAKGVSYFDIAVKNKSMRTAYIIKETSKEIQKYLEKNK